MPDRMLASIDPTPCTWRHDGARALLLALASAALHLALGQGVLYGDGPEFLVLLHEGSVGHKNHLAYLPMLRAAAALGEGCGLSPFVSARLLSQLGAALGVGVCYLAARRFGLSRSTSTWVTGVIATTPSLLFFASVVEVHAPYFAFLALAWLATAHLVAAPKVASGALLGLACAAAYGAHASGLVLPAPLLLVAAHVHRVRGGTGRALAPAAFACVAVHGALALLVPWLLSHAGHTASPANAARFLSWWKMDIVRQPSAALQVLWDEWLLAFAPLSLLWLRAFAARATRVTAYVALLALLPYLALSIALLAVYREFGAYQHAVLWLFAYLVVHTWGTAARTLCLIGGLAIGAWKVAQTDDRARVRAYAAGLAEVAGTAPPLLLIGGHEDYEHCFVAAPATAFVNLASTRFELARFDASATALDATIAAHRARGGRVFLTAGGFALLSGPGAAPGLARLLQHVQARYAHAVVAAAEFRAAELTPRE